MLTLPAQAGLRSAVCDGTMKTRFILLAICVALVAIGMTPAVRRALFAPRQSSNLAGAQSLSLLEFPVARPAGKPLVIMGSGDGGWQDMDIKMSRAFNQNGVSVLGIDMLRYLWQRKTPEEASQDLGRILTTYERQWRPSSITLVGFSKGAQLFPFMVTRLPPAQRRRIGAVVLLSPENHVNFQVHFADWLTPYLGSRFVKKFEASSPLLPEVERLSAMNVLCVYGAQDPKGGRVCRSLDSAKFTIIELPGEHHFDQNYTALVQKILQDTRARG